MHWIEKRVVRYHVIEKERRKVKVRERERERERMGAREIFEYN